MIDSFRGKYWFLSNFYMHEMVIGGITYPSVEHYFQAHKTDDEELFDRIVTTKKPSDAKKIGRSITFTKERAAKWDKQLRFRVMEKGLRSKFSDPKLKYKLIATYPQKLVEGNFHHDDFWGDCRCRKHYMTNGKNHMGKLLMKIRLELVNV